jgi:hypothetical protein
MSKSFELNKQDILNFVRATLIYIAPTALILLTQLQDQSDPNNIVYALIFSAAIDLLRRFITNYDLQNTK